MLAVQYCVASFPCIQSVVLNGTSSESAPTICCYLGNHSSLLHRARRTNVANSLPGTTEHFAVLEVMICLLGHFAVTVYNEGYFTRAGHSMLQCMSL